jgi:hypothetical protein
VILCRRGDAAGRERPRPAIQRIVGQVRDDSSRAKSLACVDLATGEARHMSQRSVGGDQSAKCRLNSAFGAEGACLRWSLRLLRMSAPSKQSSRTTYPLPLPSSGARILRSHDDPLPHSISGRPSTAAPQREGTAGAASQAAAPAAKHPTASMLQGGSSEPLSILDCKRIHTLVTCLRSRIRCEQTFDRPRYGRCPADQRCR